MTILFLKDLLEFMVPIAGSNLELLNIIEPILIGTLALTSLMYLLELGSIAPKFEGLRF